MEKTRIDVYKLGNIWKVRTTVKGAVMSPSDSWMSRTDALDVAMAIAEERFRENKESVDVYYEESGRFILVEKGFRHFT
ncbi:hypothetical protein BCL79_2741 [Stenotrophomonas rhizophila]|uniref:DUF2188 domain-containing protein n=1 Tax=Stenotrophomonas rhizophila TaxID=216778 RepID=A0A498CCK5_9GAMM|nr:hypothetical protein BCL79_2741 [Stenotrophomonas rhizophila]